MSPIARIVLNIAAALIILGGLYDLLHSKIAAQPRCDLRRQRPRPKTRS